jgi:1-acyl-sn-glycerol-3-phosphate acyltransferase
MIDLIGIKGEIKTILDGLVGDGKPFAASFGSPPKDPDVFPFVYPMLARTFAMSKQSDRLNFIPVEFVIRGVMDVRVYREENYDRMLELAQETMEELQKREHRTLNGKAHNVDDVNLQDWAFIEANSRPLLVFDIGFVAKIIHDTGGA